MKSASTGRSIVAPCLAVALATACLLALSAAARAQAVRPSAGGASGAGAQQTAQIVSAVETLSDNPSGLVKLFAKRLADVLDENKLPLSAKLKALTIQPNSVNPDEKDLVRIHDTVAVLIDPNSFAPAGGEKASASALHAELLDVIAKYCPSSDSSMEAAFQLARLAQQALSGPADLKEKPLSPAAPAGEVPAVSPEAAATALRQALYKCFDHTHCAWINKDDVIALRRSAEQDFFGTLAYLLACQGAKADANAAQPSPEARAEALGKALDAVRDRLADGAAPREADNAPGADDLLRVLAKRLDAVRKETAAIAEMAAARADISRTLQQFLAAVNQEDRKAAEACASPAMAKALEKLPSLRSAIGGAEVEKIEFQHVARFGAPDGNRFADVQVKLTAKAGRPQSRTARLSLTLTPEGYKVTTPS